MAVAVDDELGARAILRASRETELLAVYPAKAVATWLGNSVSVAMKH